MPATTPDWGYPYPLPEDPVTDYPALGRQLAEAVEAGDKYLQGNIDANAGLVDAGSAYNPNEVRIPPTGGWTNIINTPGLAPAGIYMVQGFTKLRVLNTASLYVALTLNGGLFFQSTQLGYQNIYAAYTTPPVYINSAAGGWFGIMGYEGQTNGQADWGWYAGESWVLATRVHTVLAQRTARLERDYVEALPELPPIDVQPFEWLPDEFGVLQPHART